MISTLLAAGRGRHRQLMVDTCVIEHATSGVIDDSTGDYPLTWTTVYTGPCRVKGPTAGNAAVTEVQAGEAEQVTTRLTLVLPHLGAPLVSIGDRVTVTRVGSPTLLFLVVGTVETTTMTASAFVVEQVQPGGVVLAGHPGGDWLDGGAP